MLPSAADCDECTPSYLLRRHAQISQPSSIISYLPFILTFFIVATIVSQKVLPLLAAPSDPKEHGTPKWMLRMPQRIAITTRQISAAACAATLALSAVLVELILCEVADTVEPSARGFALRTTLISLLGLIVVLVPALEIFTLVTTRIKTRPRDSTGTFYLVKLGATALFLGIWLACFWYLPNISILRNAATAPKAKGNTTSKFLQGCLQRIGIVGIAIMASLAGFATVSSIWQNLGPKKRPVRDLDIIRKETGLESVHAMLEAKQSRLRALERRLSQESPSRGFLARVATTFSPNSASVEKQSLELEIDGLETMAASLEGNLASLRATSDSQRLATTPLGKLLHVAGLIFAIYCLYRTCSITLSTITRVLRKDARGSTDPISNLLGLLTTLYDPTLDAAAWARQFSFAMSGVVLLLSFNAVLQTFRLFTRFLPSVVLRAHAAFPLVLSQVAGTYVISSAIMLRSNLPPEVGGVITEALGAPLDTKFAHAWFEGWFLAMATITAIGIAVSRTAVIRDWDDWDEVGEAELGKQN